MDVVSEYNPVNILAEKDITDDEVQLYDRQIRLWGVEAQRQLRKANVLLVGLSGVGSEITKNIVLSGINSLTIIDHQDVTESDSLSHLFTRHMVSENRAKVAEQYIKQLNPMVRITALDWNIKDQLKNQDKELISLLKKVNVVCVTNYDQETMVKLNSLLRKLNGDQVKFYGVCSWGFYGVAFVDLGRSYKYVVEEVSQAEVEIGEEPLKKKVKAEDQDVTFVQKSLSYPSLETVMSVKAGKAGVGLTKRTNPCYILAHVMFKFHSKHGRYPLQSSRETDTKELQELAVTVCDELGMDAKIMGQLTSDHWWDKVFCEISPVCAVVGGIVGQDIIRSVSEKDTPIKNVFIFNGVQANGSIETIGR